MWLDRLENLNFFAANWFKHQTRDAYWEHGSICENFDDIRIPVMIVSGWNDLYVNALPALMDNIKGHCHSVCGPWAHHFPHLGTPGPSYDYLGASLAWWHQWLGNDQIAPQAKKTHLTFIKESADPKPFDLSVAGRWIESQTWPPSIKIKHKYLSKDGLTDKVVNPSPIQIHSPVETGVEAGEWIPHCSGSEISGCQKSIDAQSTCFDSDILEKHIDVFGRPEITISLRSNAPTGNLIVRLCDVSPSGSSELVSIGVLNLTHRNGNKFPKLMPIGETQSLAIKLDNTGHRFLPGQKIRIALSTAYWPFVWPAVNNPTLTLTEKPACLSLPTLVNLEEEDVQPNPPVAPPMSAITQKRKPNSNRDVEYDFNENKVKLKIKDDLGELLYHKHNLVTSAIKHEYYEISNNAPLSSMAQISWSFEYSRDNWMTRTITETIMTSDEKYYYLKAKVRAYENEKTIFEKSFKHKIIRVNG